MSAPMPNGTPFSAQLRARPGTLTLGAEGAADGQDELLARRRSGWRTGQDVVHEEHGAGWVWGSGLGRVTVRFEGPRTRPGPVRTLAEDDPRLHPADPPDWRGSPS